MIFSENRCPLFGIMLLWLKSTILTAIYAPRYITTFWSIEDRRHSAQRATGPFPRAGDKIASVAQAVATTHRSG
jgi:hypothetical protein